MYAHTIMYWSHCNTCIWIEQWINWWFVSENETFVHINCLLLPPCGQNPFIMLNCLHQMMYSCLFRIIITVFMWIRIKNYYSHIYSRSSMFFLAFYTQSKLCYLTYVLQTGGVNLGSYIKSCEKFRAEFFWGGKNMYNCCFTFYNVL